MILKAARALVGPDLLPTEDVSIAVEAGRITALDGNGDGEVLELGDLTLLPGFIDAHVHIGFADPADVLQGGVTTVRDLAWVPDDIFGLAERSRGKSFRGPLVLCVGPMLTVESGYPTRAGWAPTGTGRAVTSADDAHAAVVENARRGAQAIKVGLNAQVGPTLDRDLLTAICAAAHAIDLGVTAHIYGLGELTKAIEAGVDELAHILMSPESIPDEVIAAMVERSMVVIPTLSIFSGRELEVAVGNMARFVSAGGRVVYGTDLGNEGPGPGIDPLEIERMVAAGLDGHRVVTAATSDAASHLGLASKGNLAAGYDADIIGVAGDPLTRPQDLCDVRFVMRSGRIVERP